MKNISKMINKAVSLAHSGWPKKYMGLQFPYDETIMSEAIVKAIDGHWYEADEAAHIPYIFHENDRVLELGTGLGLISALTAKNPLVDHIISVEANPMLIDYIKNFHQVNGVSSKIEVMNGVAVPSPASDKVKFYCRQDFWASSMDPSPWGYNQVIEVPTIDLNKVIAEFEPTKMIVDIEGGETRIFEGLRSGSVKRILMEVHQNVVGREAMRKLFMQLGELGFHYDQWHSVKNVVTFSHVDL